MNNVPTKQLAIGDQRTWNRFQRFLAELNEAEASRSIQTAVQLQVAATLALAAAVDEVDETLERANTEGA